MAINNSNNALIVCVILLVTTLIFIQSFQHTEAGKRRVHIPDELDDVVDDEEDEEWKQWGGQGSKSSLPDLDPAELQNMDPIQIQAELMKRQSGPAFGFVKLRFGVKRTTDMVSELAMKWTKILKTGAVEVRFMGVDLSTIMFNLPRGQDTEELVDFILSQTEVYEVKIGEQAYRRPGDPPLEVVLEKLNEERNKKDDSNHIENAADKKEEL